MDGEIDRAMDHFQQAFQREPYFRSQIIEVFGQQGPEFFEHSFQLDLDGLRRLHAHYRRAGLVEFARGDVAV